MEVDDYPDPDQDELDEDNASNHRVRESLGSLAESPSISSENDSWSELRALAMADEPESHPRGDMEKEYFKQTDDSQQSDIPPTPSTPAGTEAIKQLLHLVQMKHQQLQLGGIASVHAYRLETFLYCAHLAHFCRGVLLERINPPHQLLRALGLHLHHKPLQH